MWVNLKSIGLIAVVLIVFFIAIGVIISAVQPPTYEVTYDCRIREHVDFPLEARAKCNQLMNRIKNGTN